MKCPKCQSGCNVYDSRARKSGEIRRRRKCKKCENRFTTLEFVIDNYIIEDMTPEEFLKPNGVYLKVNEIIERMNKFFK